MLLQESAVCKNVKINTFLLPFQWIILYKCRLHPRGVYVHLVALSLKKITNSAWTIGEKLQKNINNSKTPRRLISRKCLRTASMVQNSSWGIVKRIVTSTIIYRTLYSFIQSFLKFSPRLFLPKIRDKSSLCWFCYGCWVLYYNKKHPGSVKSLWTALPIKRCRVCQRMTERREERR